MSIPLFIALGIFMAVVGNLVAVLVVVEMAHPRRRK